MRIPKEAREITLSVLALPELHYKACFEDISGRPSELNCSCPLKRYIEKIVLSIEG